jgi:hypothetical protein
MTTASRKKQKTQPSDQSETQNKREYKRDEQEPTNPNAPKHRDQGNSGTSDQGVKPTEQPQHGGTGSADPKFDQTKPLADDWGKSDKH